MPVRKGGERREAPMWCLVDEALAHAPPEGETRRDIREWILDNYEDIKDKDINRGLNEALDRGDAYEKRGRRFSLTVTAKKRMGIKMGREEEEGEEEEGGEEEGEEEEEEEERPRKMPPGRRSGGGTRGVSEQTRQRLREGGRKGGSRTGRARYMRRGQASTRGMEDAEREAEEEFVPERDMRRSPEPKEEYQLGKYEKPKRAEDVRDQLDLSEEEFEEAAKDTRPIAQRRGDRRAKPRGFPQLREEAEREASGEFYEGGEEQEEEEPKKRRGEASKGRKLDRDFFREMGKRGAQARWSKEDVDREFPRRGPRRQVSEEAKKGLRQLGKIGASRRFGRDYGGGKMSERARRAGSEIGRMGARARWAEEGTKRDAQEEGVEDFIADDEEAEEEMRRTSGEEPRY